MGNGRNGFRGVIVMLVVVRENGRDMHDVEHQPQRMVEKNVKVEIETTTTI